ncbi:TlpA family protein disulfide reductase [Anaerosacchariphilus polymeriproducens]|uniref:TlpA family protein disulfide reductase n=1 Tax=Anaerosacchariphilus polymeriproducens TaxID=1812858 RepID=A0A371AYJ0_9FIRM|nr:TlpA disulfide reductase family protein [Anaerosacchariphilus polymeriproducens]RDU24609.1 TlpA family protein disulfide reductase [Anaerosacchariphilus polymeriproducens]
MKKFIKSKITAALLCTFIITLLLAGCTQSKKSNTGKNSGNQEKDYDYTGFEDYTEDSLGITLKLPSKYLNNETIIPGKYEIMFGDISQLGKDTPKSETDPTEHMDLFYMPQKGEYCLFRILAYPSDKWDNWMNSGKKATDITGSSVSEEISRKDGTVYIYDQPTVDTSTLDSKNKASYEEIVKMLPAIRASIKAKASTMGDLGTFSTKDLNGKAVDNSIFSGHKLTMINIWATFCRPCIKELPDLQKMSENMPEGTQLLSIVGDADDDKLLKLAQQILKDKGVSYTNIIPDKPLKQYLDKNMVAYPTTLFVDSSGKIVGEPIIGERDMSVYKEILNERLAQVGP